MKFRVYETETNKDVTDNGEWFIDMGGRLLHVDDDINYPIYVWSESYYYKLEIEVF